MYNLLSGERIQSLCKKKKKRKTNKKPTRSGRINTRELTMIISGCWKSFFLGRRPGNTVKFQKVSPKFRRRISQIFIERVLAEEAHCTSENPSSISIGLRSRSYSIREPCSYQAAPNLQIRSNTERKSESWKV